MAEAFLTQLLRVENSVQPPSNDRCIICLSAYGTLCADTGIVEFEIRLPCKHTVGSRCIATWLGPAGAANNSCPVCRHVFFPALPRPYLEHGIMHDDGDDDDDDLDHIIDSIGSSPAPPRPYLERGIVHDGDYVDLDHIDDFRDSEDLDLPPLSPTPSDRYEGEEPVVVVVEEEEEDEEDEMHGGPIDNVTHAANLSTIETMSETYCHRLNLTSHPRAIDISHHLGEKIHRARLFDRYTPSSIAALSVYMTSHFTGAPKTLHLVSDMCGVHVEHLKVMYMDVRFFATAGVEIVDEEALAMIGRGDVGTVLRCLPRA